MIVTNPPRLTARPESVPARTHLQEALEQAELGAYHLEIAHDLTGESLAALDGYQPSTMDIARDTPTRDVSPSARALKAQANSSSLPAQTASGRQYDALASLHGAISALDQALPELSPQDRRDALQARRQLDQQDPLWHADVALSGALAAIQGGAVPYIDAAEQDAPGIDVSWTSGEIAGSLREATGQVHYAGNLNGKSLQTVHQAVATLRAIHQRQHPPAAFHVEPGPAGKA